jgi:DNA polymerase elongation subunit (family B)
MIDTKIPHNKIQFIDIESATGGKDIFAIGPQMAMAWQRVCDSKYKDEMKEPNVTAGSLYKKYAALYPEFGRIVCISIGYFKNETDIAVKAFYHEDERALLKMAMEEMTRLSGNYRFICGHNIKHFDIPFIIRRAVILNMFIPTFFDIYGVKPWDLKQFVDTMEIWQCGSFTTGSCTLDSIACALGLSSPKDEMSGDMVSTVFWMPSGPGFVRIAKYCNFDVISDMAVYIRITKGADAMKSIKVAENVYE